MSRTYGRDYKRIVVKAGTSLLTKGTNNLDFQIINSLVDQIASLQFRGKEMILVSSGAVAAGREAINSLSHIDESNFRSLSERQVLAAVGQGKLMHVYEQSFASHGILVAQALVSRRDVNDRLGYLNLRNTLSALLSSEVVPIINENDVVAVEELAGEVFGDNDNLSALIANLVDADLLLILGTVRGMYTKDPNLHEDAEIVPVVKKVDESIDLLGGPSSDDIGRGGMITKLEAARLATVSGVDVVIASGLEAGAINRVASGENLGTLFESSVSSLESRKRWMLSKLSGGGEDRNIEVDSGAVLALTEGNTSLLPAGVIRSTSEFQRGDVVSVTNLSRDVKAVGITNYSSEDIKRIAGVRSDMIEAILGYHYGDEVIHRDNLVLLVE